MLEIIYIVVLTLLALTTSLHALLKKRDSKSALAWVAVCLAIPLFGPLTYIVFGINRIATTAHRIYLPKTEKDISEAIDEPTGTDFRPMSLIGEMVIGQGLRSCDDIQVLENGEALYPAMLQDINSATEKVYCSTYIFQNDKTGDDFVNAFVAAKERGVDVRVIIDGLGAIAYGSRITRKLRNKKLNFKLFNPIKLFPPSLRINMRNHRKILLVDGKCVYTGGQNIGDRHLADKQDNPHRALDLHFRLSGKIVDELERAFLKDWNHCTGRLYFSTNNRITRDCPA